MINWKKQALGDLLQYTQPSHFIVNNTEYDSEFQTPVLTPGKSFILGYTNEQEGIYDRLPTIIFDDFTTAFKYVDFPFKVKSSAMKMLNTTSVNFDIKFIYYLMQTINFEAKEHKRYWISKYSQLQVRIPPLEEQKKIAAILDAADDYRQKTKALIDKYDQLTQSLFLDMFGDPVTNPMGLPTIELGKACEFYSGKAWKKQELGSKGVKLIRISNLHKPNFPYWLYEGNIIERYKVENGDLLFSWAGVQASIDVYLYKGDTGMLNQHIYNLKPKTGIEKLFLFQLLQLNLNALRSSLGGGVGQFHLKKKDITSIKVLMPQSSDMQLYLKKVDSLNKQKQQAEASLVKAEELFNSLLQKAFKGELTC